MRILIATTNPVTISFTQALLKSEGILSFLFDQQQSLLDGSIGIIPQRICVVDEEYEAAIAVLKEAEMEHEIYRD